ncbi:MAG: hypothetical protein VX898_01910 [Candidatus Thermoplasmatota archaeon]|nr:hypothetical protein [Candidatus Thermoplasmatota archaeon]
MEQKVRNLGVFVATLAMIASVLIVPGASANGHDLEITGFGDNGITSYASEYGTASFDISVSSMSDGSHTNVLITVAITNATGMAWGGSSDVNDCSGDPDDDSPGTTLSGGSTISACIDVGVGGSNSNIGDTAEMVVNVTSDEDPLGSEMNFGIQVANWFAYSDDGVKSYEENGTHTYTVTVDNLKKDTDGDTGLALNDPIDVIYTTLQGWDIQSDYAGWDGNNTKATVNSIAANASVDIVLEIRLVGQIVPASSYVGISSIVFTVQDGLSPPLLIELQASIADNLNVAVTGAGGQTVYNGCSDTAVSVTWDAVIKNFGNKPDTFAYTFDTSGLASGWTVDGDTNDNTGSLGAKFEGGETTVSLGMWIPGGLSAGTTSGFTMTVISDGDTSVTQTQSFSATVDQCYDMEMTVDSLMGSAVPGDSADFTIVVTNTGNGPDTISFLVMNANAEWSPSLSESQLAVASGATGTTVFSMTVPSDAEADAPSGEAMIHAYSSDGVVEKSVTVSAKAGQTYGVDSGYYYNATMGSVSVQEGMSVQMKFNVTNTGNGFDDVALSLAGAPEWITLEDDLAELAPGGTMSLVINVAAPLSGSVGDYVFQVVATSEDGTTTSTTSDFTATVTEKGTSGGPTTEELDEEEGGLPGFGALSAIAAIGAVLLIRRRL